jgi:hypothetical protein
MCTKISPCTGSLQTESFQNPIGSPFWEPCQVCATSWEIWLHPDHLLGSVIPVTWWPVVGLLYGDCRVCRYRRLRSPPFNIVHFVFLPAFYTVLLVQFTGSEAKDGCSGPPNCFKLRSIDPEKARMRWQIIKKKGEEKETAPMEHLLRFCNKYCF